MGFFSFEFSKGYYYFILYWILDLFNSIERDIFEDNNKGSSTTNNNNSTNEDTNLYSKEISLLYVALLIIGDLSAGILVIITKVRMKSLNEKKKLPKLKTNYELIYTDLSIKKNKHLYILLISILDFLGRSSEFFFFLFISSKKLEVLQTGWLISIDIFYRAIFCYYILKIKLERHHTLSIILCSVGFIIMAYFGIRSTIEFCKSNESNAWIYLLFSFFKKILFSLEDVFNKILLTNKFLLPHFLMFWRGLTNLIIFLIMILIFYWTSIIDFTNYKYLNLTNALEITRKIILIISLFGRTFSIFKIIDIFTPQHVGFVNVVYCLIEIIKYTIKQKEIEDVIHFIFGIISIIVIILGTILFNEMIIINAFGLSDNTKSGIKKKEKLENIELNSTEIFENEENKEDKIVGLNDLLEENEEVINEDDEDKKNVN